MIDLLDRKIRQMHAALAGLTNDDLSDIHIEVGEDDGWHCVKIDFAQGADEIACRNVASLLIANIAEGSPEGLVPRRATRLSRRPVNR